jgi:hypothetical protein
MSTPLTLDPPSYDYYMWKSMDAMPEKSSCPWNGVRPFPAWGNAKNSAGGEKNVPKLTVSFSMVGNVIFRRKPKEDSLCVVLWW